MRKVLSGLMALLSLIPFGFMLAILGDMESAYATGLRGFVGFVMAFCLWAVLCFTGESFMEGGYY